MYLISDAVEQSSNTKERGGVARLTLQRQSKWMNEK